MFKAHGVAYQTEAEAMARWNALEAINPDPGVGYSDGRVTEQLLIMEAIEADRAAKAAMARAGREREWEANRQASIRRNRERLAQIERAPFLAYDGEHFIIWFDADGHRRVSRYVTEKGWLKALIRIESDRRMTLHDAE